MIFICSLILYCLIFKQEKKVYGPMLLFDLLICPSNFSQLTNYKVLLKLMARI